MGIEHVSPEAVSAAAAYDGVRDRVGTALLDCASGRELVAAGFARDVEIAAAVGVSRVVPTLRGEAFGDAGPAAPQEG
jgi:2-phosphosulfolactate phosphatase